MTTPVKLGLKHKFYSFDNNKTFFSKYLNISIQSKTHSVQLGMIPPLKNNPSLLGIPPLLWKPISPSSDYDTDQPANGALILESEPLSLPLLKLISKKLWE